MTQDYFLNDHCDYLFHRLGPRRRAMLEEMGLKVYSPKNAGLDKVVEAKKIHSNTPQTIEKPSEKPIEIALKTQKPFEAEGFKSHFAARSQAADLMPEENLAAVLKENVWEISGLHKITTKMGQGENPASAHWLILTDVPFVPASPLAHLLENLAQALQMSQTAPALWVAHVGRQGADVQLAAMVENQDKSTMYPLHSGLVAHCAAQAFGLIVLAGRTSAQAVLGLEGALGALRAGDYVVDFQAWAENANVDASIELCEKPLKIPAITTYDIPYLLRAPAAKSAFWDDMCRALARVENARVE